MTTYLITRHPGALDWVMHQGLVIDCVLEHLEPSILEALQPGDIVIGSLPIHLVAQVCARGAHFVNLSLEQPRGLRGQELDAPTLERLAVRLEAYDVRRCTLPPALQPQISRHGD